jgi:hypothetical protein
MALKFLKFFDFFYMTSNYYADGPITQICNADYSINND